MIKLIKKFPVTFTLIGMIAAGTAVFLLLFPVLPECYGDLSEMIGPAYIHLLLVSLILALGYGFHCLRKRTLMVYAITEISFAVASSWHAADYLINNNGLMASVPILASMYVFVRGSANLEEAKNPTGDNNIHIGGVS